MWARKRIDISNWELFRAIGSCVWSDPPETSIKRICQSFEPHSNLLIALSVRSGFDLLLKSASQMYGWPEGSEVIFSGMTIADMPRIALNRDLLAVGTDLNPLTMSPRVEDIASKITSNTKAIVVAHLMGSRCPLEEIAQLAKKHGLLLIEDCAQSFTGQMNDVSPLADVSMFSFGPIKTNTALGGAILRTKDRELHRLMENHHAKWPIRARSTYLKRVLKYLFMVKPISSWTPAYGVKTFFRLIGSNHDALAAGMARGFAKGDFFKKIRQQPSPALLTVMAKRLTQFDPSKITKRTRRGKLLSQTILHQNGDLTPLGMLGESPTHWVYAIVVENPTELVQRLWAAGFDATSHSSLVPVDPNNIALRKLVSHTVFLPIDPPMSRRELNRMGTLVGKVGNPVNPNEFRWIQEPRNTIVHPNQATFAN